MMGFPTREDFAISLKFKLSAVHPSASGSLAEAPGSVLDEGVLCQAALLLALSGARVKKLCLIVGISDGLLRK